MLHPRSLRRVALVAMLAVAVAVTIGAETSSALRRVRNPYPGRGTAPSMEVAIASTWPSHLHRDAMNVAWCESSGKASARRGQYKGHFQMGTAEWRRYGNGNPFNAVDNSAAAYRYYRAVGSWRPWQCQP